MWTTKRETILRADELTSGGVLATAHKGGTQVLLADRFGVLWLDRSRSRLSYVHSWDKTRPGQEGGPMRPTAVSSGLGGPVVLVYDATTKMTLVELAVGPTSRPVVSGPAKTLEVEDTILTVCPRLLRGKKILVLTFKGLQVYSADRSDMVLRPTPQPSEYRGFGASLDGGAFFGIDKRGTIWYFEMDEKGENCFLAKRSSRLEGLFKDAPVNVFLWHFEAGVFMPKRGYLLYSQEGKAYLLNLESEELTSTDCGLLLSVDYIPSKGMYLFCALDPKSESPQLRFFTLEGARLTGIGPWFSVPDNVVGALASADGREVYTVTALPARLLLWNVKWAQEKEAVVPQELHLLAPESQQTSLVRQVALRQNGTALVVTAGGAIKRLERQNGGTWSEGMQIGLGGSPSVDYLWTTGAPWWLSYLTLTPPQVCALDPNGGGVICSAIEGLPECTTNVAAASDAPRIVWWDDDSVEGLGFKRGATGHPELYRGIEFEIGGNWKGYWVVDVAASGNGEVWVVLLEGAGGAGFRFLKLVWPGGENGVGDGDPVELPISLAGAKDPGGPGGLAFALDLRGERLALASIGGEGVLVESVDLGKNGSGPEIGLKKVLRLREGYSASWARLDGIRLAGEVLGVFLSYSRGSVGSEIVALEASTGATILRHEIENASVTCFDVTGTGTGAGVIYATTRGDVNVLYLSRAGK